MTRFSFKHSDTLQAYGYDKNDKLVSSYYDSGFRCFSQVYSALERSYHRTSHASIHKMEVINKDQDTYAWYKVYGDMSIQFKKC